MIAPNPETRIPGLQVEERRQRPRMSESAFARRGPNGSRRRAAALLKVWARGAWESLVLTLSALAMAGAVAAFLFIAAAGVAKALRLPAWLLYAVLGTSGLLAGFLLWRVA